LKIRVSVVRIRLQAPFSLRGFPDLIPASALMRAIVACNRRLAGRMTCGTLLKELKTAPRRVFEQASPNLQISITKMSCCAILGATKGRDSHEPSPQRRNPAVVP
jgi:hypothetical protein